MRIKGGYHDLLRCCPCDWPVVLLISVLLLQLNHPFAVPVCYISVTWRIALSQDIRSLLFCHYVATGGKTGSSRIIYYLCTFIVWHRSWPLQHTCTVCDKSAKVNQRGYSVIHVVIGPFV